MQCQSIGSPCPKKARMSESKLVKTPICFFNCKRTVHQEFAPWSDRQPDVSSPSFGASETVGSSCDVRTFPPHVHPAP
jgi:hypothetical protein